MASEGVVPLAGVSVPDFGSAVERASDDFIAIRVIKGKSVDDVLMFVER